MNRLFTSIVLALGLFSYATAQNSNSMSLPQDPNEVVVLSSFIDGNYNVERLLVLESSANNNEFVVHYKINLTQLNASYSNNSTEIGALHNFIERMQGDSLKQVTHFDIIGHTSPDGPTAINNKLAKERAVDFEKFLDKDYDMSGCNRTVQGQPYHWIDAKEAIQKSDIPNKSEIIALINSGTLQGDIQAGIEKYPAAWDYIKSNILPQMRCVDISIKYNSWKVVENRTIIEEITPEPTIVVVDVDEEQNAEQYVDDYIYCMLVEVPGSEIDFGDCKEREKFKANRHGAKFKERGKGERDKFKEHGKRGRTKVKEHDKLARWWRR